MLTTCLILPANSAKPNIQLTRSPPMVGQCTPHRKGICTQIGVWACQLSNDTQTWTFRGSPQFSQDFFLFFLSRRLSNQSDVFKTGLKVPPWSECWGVWCRVYGVACVWCGVERVVGEILCPRTSPHAQRLYGVVGRLM